MAFGKVSSGNLREKLEEEQAKIIEGTADEADVNKKVVSTQDVVTSLISAIDKALEIAHPLRNGLGDALDVHAGVRKTIKSAASNIADLVDDTNRADVGRTADDLGDVANAAKAQRGELAAAHKTSQDVVTKLEELKGMLGLEFANSLGALAVATGSGETGIVGRLEEVNAHMETYVPGL